MSKKNFSTDSMGNVITDIRPTKSRLTAVRVGLGHKFLV